MEENHATLVPSALLAFLLLTVTVGFALRWQMAGFDLGRWSHFDLRRAHSHLAFYGVVFPLVWLAGAGASSFLRRRWVLLTYFLSVLVSFAGFLIQGYGPISIAGSTLVLGIWLIFAVDLWRVQEAVFLKTLPLFVFLAALAILFVAIFSKTDPALANKIVRSFLTCILFGVLVPACGYAVLMQNDASPSARTGDLWAASAAASALFLPELVTHRAFGVGPVVLGVLVLAAVYTTRRAWTSFSFVRVSFYWALFGSALILSGLGLIQQTHFTAIAGVHFLILGPVLLTILELAGEQSTRHIRPVYEGAVLAMAGAIFLQSYLADHFSLLQLIAAGSGTVVVACLGVGIGLLAFHQRTGRSCT